MMTGLEQDVVYEGIRVLFLLTMPIVGIVCVAGTVISALQAAMSLSEPALSYAIRLIAFIVLLYLLFPVYSRTMLALAERAFQ